MRDTEAVTHVDEPARSDAIATPAKGRGWFSLALGVMELAAPEKLERRLSVGDRVATVCAREPRGIDDIPA